MDFFTAISNFGVAVACLLALGIAVWRGIIFIGNEILRPLAARHVKFLDDLSQAVAAQSQAIQTLAIQQGRVIECMEMVTGKPKDGAKPKDGE